MAETQLPPVGTVGQVLKFAWAGWVRARDAREAHREIGQMLDSSLRRALCPHSPELDETRALADRIFARLDATSPPSGRTHGRFRRAGERLRQKMPRVVRRNRLPKVARFGHETFEQLLGRWIGDAVNNAEIAAELAKLRCTDAAVDAATLAERFPGYFVEALEGGSESKWRAGLLASLFQADEDREKLEERARRRRAVGGAAAGLTAGAAGVVTSEVAGSQDATAVIIGGAAAAVVAT